MFVSPITFSDLFDSNEVFLAPRTLSEENYGEFSSSSAIQDMSSLWHLDVLGDTPFLGHRDYLSEMCLKLRSVAGLPQPTNRILYQNAQDYQGKVEHLWTQGKKATVFWPFSPAWDTKGKFVYSPEKLRLLCNKGNLSRLVPSQWNPLRHHCTRQELLTPGKISLPCVLKVAIDEPAGAGNGVRICQTDTDLEQAAQAFKNINSFVVENLVPAVLNLCMHFAVHSDGKTRYLGSAEQIISEQTKYSGNWFGKAISVPKDALDAGIACAQNLASLGYTGLAGFDILIDAQGKAWVVDANIRLNGSSAGVMLQNQLTEHMEQSEFMSKGIYNLWNQEALYDLGAALFEAKIAVPRYLTPSPFPEYINGLNVWLFGKSKEQASARKDFLNSALPSSLDDISEFIRALQKIG